VKLGSWTLMVPVAVLIGAGAPPSLVTAAGGGGPAAIPAGAGVDQSTAVTASAAVQAFFATDLYAKAFGYVSHINADIGDRVQEGQILAVIDDPETQAQYVRVLAGVQQAKAALDVARRQLIGLQADRTLQLLTLKRQKELFAGNAATAQALDEANAREQASEANAETGQANIELAQANLQAAEAESQRLQALLAYTRIVAPFTGTVTRRLVNPGDLVQGATGTRAAPLFTIQQLDPVRVFADVPESNAVGIRPGQAATVRLYEPPGHVIRGLVTRIASALDPASRTMRVEIDLPNQKETLLPGMYAQVTFGPVTVAANAPKRESTAN
jgi:multidrug efflux pump subunit AcrA (membrane-fusion protein)